MKHLWQPRSLLRASSIVLLSLPAFAQQPQPSNPAPLYRVTVVERTTKAVNYEYRSEPTPIDFRGTVLLPKAKGDAIVQSQQGRTQIDAHLSGLESPDRFGREYLTYVLWAITPEGRPHNIGELVTGSSNKANISVTTDLQAFALIVTAEPYSAVRQPSNVVVAENEVRPDTIGTIEPLEAKYELLPRGTYVYNQAPPPPDGPKVSMREYEALSQIYQAQNAINAATLANADRYAPDTLARAKQDLLNAQQMHDHKGDLHRVVQDAREAAQTAEDARMLAIQRADTERTAVASAQITAAQAEIISAKQAQARAEQQAQQARVEAATAKVDAQNAALAKAQAEADAAQARDRAAQAQAQASQTQANALPPPPPVGPQEARQRELRQKVFADVKGSSAFPTLDTGRGIVSTIPDDGFRAGVLRDGISPELAQFAHVVARYPGLRVSIEGYADTADKQALTAERAEAVRHVLTAAGLPASSVSASGLGDARPLGPNATEQDRRKNCRVEIVISGEPIGHLPLWERSYTLSSSTILAR